MNAADYRLKLALDLASQLMGAPRHLGQYPGGFVLTQDRLDDLVPIEPASMKDRQVVEWDSVQRLFAAGVSLADTGIGTRNQRDLSLQLFVATVGALSMVGDRLH
jgi:hypothetical protein